MARAFPGSAGALAGMGLWVGLVWGDGKCGQGCPRTRPRVARAFPVSSGAIAGMGLWWGEVMTDTAGKDARGPDLVWRVPCIGSAGALACMGLWWGDVGGPPPPMGGSRIGRGSRSGPD